MEEREKGRSCENEDGIMDFRRCKLTDSFYVAPDEAYIDEYGVLKYNNHEPEFELEPSDIISINKINNAVKINE